MVMVRRFRAYKKDEGKKGIFRKCPATVTHRQFCDFAISIILAHDADVSLCVHVLSNYHFWCPLIVPDLLENSSICTFAICCPHSIPGWPFQPKSSPLNVVFILQDLGIPVRLTHSSAC